MIGATGITIPGLISFIAFNMTTVPCFAAVATAKGEVGVGKFKWTLFFWLCSSYIVGTLVYAFGSAMQGETWAIIVSVCAVVFAIVFALGIVWYNKRQKQKGK